MQNNLMKIADGPLLFLFRIITTDGVKGNQWASFPHEAEDD